MCLVALPLLRYWPSFSKVQACSWNDNRFWLDISAEGDEGGKGGFGSVSTNRALIPRPWCYFLEALVRVPNNCLYYLHTKECRESVGTQKKRLSPVSQKGTLIFFTQTLQRPESPKNWPSQKLPLWQLPKAQWHFCRIGKTWLSVSSSFWHCLRDVRRKQMLCCSIF